MYGYSIAAHTLIDGYMRPTIPHTVYRHVRAAAFFAVLRILSIDNNKMCNLNLMMWEISVEKKKNEMEIHGTACELLEYETCVFMFHRNQKWKGAERRAPGLQCDWFLCQIFKNQS